MTRRSSPSPGPAKKTRARGGRAGPALRQTSRPSARETARILEERARELARPPPTAEAPGPTLEVVTFTIDGERLALDVRYVQAVARTPPVTPAPAAPEGLLGVTGFRGEVVAVFDLAGAQAPRAQALFLGRDAIEMAIVADAVEDVVRLRADAIVPQPWRTAARGPRRGLMATGLSVLDGQALLEDDAFMVGPTGVGAG